jgi:2-amino-4-hydroxy-6-hydroxymethyldihydropteridine diphosphokinase
MRAFLSLGSNLGDRRAYLREAITALPDVVAVSPVYETVPIGGPQQEMFLNIVVQLETKLTPALLLGICHRIETAANRVREERWGPRTLDIDIVWIDGVDIDTPTLTIPHPRWKERRFVLAPLRDLAPDLVSERELEHSEGRVNVVEGLE